MTRTFTIEYDDELLRSLHMTPDEFAREVRFLAMAKLYELGKVSSGKAARLCGMGRVEFLLALKRVGVAVSNLSADDLEADLKLARG